VLNAGTDDVLSSSDTEWYRRSFNEFISKSILLDTLIETEINRSECTLAKQRHMADLLVLRKAKSEVRITILNGLRLRVEQK